MKSRTATLLSFLLTSTSAYDYSCPKQDISSFNASGVVTFEVDYPLPQVSSKDGEVIHNVPNPSWAYTVNATGDTFIQDFWYSPNGQNYSNDLAIGYDACAYIMVGGIPINTIELGQNDPGNCSSMLSWDCRNALMTRAAASALQWTTYSSPPPYSNLSAGVLPTICDKILEDLTDDNGKYNYPKECGQELNTGVSLPHSKEVYHVVDYEQGTLTGFNSSIIDNNCSMQANNLTYYKFGEGLSEGLGDTTYNNLTRMVYPALTVIFPVANSQRTSFYSAANATLQCLRASNFTDESVIPPPLPTGTPYHSGGLSKGSIAGIVVGVVVGVAIIVGIVTWFFLRRRKQKRQATEQRKHSDDTQANNNNNTAEIEGTQVYELSPVDRPWEADGEKINEMAHGWAKAKEMNSDKPAELDS